MERQNELEEIHRKLNKWKLHRHMSPIDKWKEMSRLLDELGDVIYQEKSECPVCGSTNTRTTLIFPENETEGKTYTKECVNCVNIWKTTEI